MNNIAATASSGLQAAQLRLHASAHNIANMQTPAFRRQQVELQAAPEQGGVLARSSQAAQPADGVALEVEAVEQLAASYAFKANVLVLRTVQDMAGTLLDVRA